MPDMIEQQRLEGLYEKLRLKLLDLSKKNRMLNYSLGVRSQRYLQVIDDVLEDVYEDSPAMRRGSRYTSVRLKRE